MNLLLLLSAQIGPLGLLQNIQRLVDGGAKSGITCNGDQEYAARVKYTTIDPVDAIANAIEHGSCCFKWKCKLCEAGTFGVGGECLSCPSFTHSLIKPRSSDL